MHVQIALVVKKEKGFNVLLYLKTSRCVIDEVDLSLQGSLTLTGADEETADSQ